MSSRDGRWTICYNGELYNTDLLCSMIGLSAESRRGHSDTEVFVEFIANRGVENAVRMSVGMFAFALWDSAKQELWLGRDRFGEKPLYFAQTSEYFAFGSELRALRGLPGLDETINSEALHDLMRYGYVRGGKSILNGVNRLPPGTIMRIANQAEVGNPVVYWAPTIEAADAVGRSPLPIEELHNLLAETVQSRMVSDVPLGAFLSGGVDSSLVVALMSQFSSQAVKTFTIGFSDRAFDESTFAKHVSSHLGTEHHEWVLSDGDVLSVIPQLPVIYDEPFADSSQIPTYLVSSFTRRHVTVALSGDGGDELFAGYERYRAIRLQARLQDAIPMPVRALGSRFALSRSAEGWNKAANRLPRWALPGALRNRAGERLHKFGRMIAANGSAEAYDLLICSDPESRDVVRAAGGVRVPRWGYDDPVIGAMLQDTEVYLPDDILTKVDRASMANSLEVRVPLLDPRLFDAAWRIPRPEMIMNGRGKAPLRDVLETFLPNELIDRPKSGFGVPLAEWLRGPLRFWADDLLDPVAIDSQGLLVGSEIRRRWNEHVSGSVDFSAQLWPVLMFQSWLDQWS